MLRKTPFKFRLNVYSYKNKYPDKKLISEPIYFVIRKANSFNDVTIDLSQYNLIVNDDIIVTVECLNDIGAEQVAFYATLFRGRFYTRNTSQDKWISAPNKSIPIAFGIAMTATIKY